MSESPQPGSELQDAASDPISPAVPRQRPAQTSRENRQSTDLSPGANTHPILVLDNLNNCTFSPIHHNIYNFHLSNQDLRQLYTEAGNTGASIRERPQSSIPSQESPLAPGQHPFPLLQGPQQTVGFPPDGVPPLREPQGSRESREGLRNESAPSRVESIPDGSRPPSTSVPAIPPPSALPSLAPSTPPSQHVPPPASMPPASMPSPSQPPPTSSPNPPFPVPHPVLPPPGPTEAPRFPDPEPASNMQARQELEGWHMVLNYISDAAGKVYRLGHLCLPSIYISRIQLMNESWLDGRSNRGPTQEASTDASRAEKHDGKSQTWQDMIDELAEEWRTLTIISVMLIPGILTLLQLLNAGSDPVTRSLSFLSLTQASWSLVFSCLYLVRFRRLRSKDIDSWRESALAAASPEKSNWFWNVGVMLALPIVTLAWSMIIFMVAIIWFLWRSSATNDNLTLYAPPRTELGFQIVLCVFFVISMGYFVLAVTRPFRYSIKGHHRFTTDVKGSPV